jgi:hypothetical protein
MSRSAVLGLLWLTLSAACFATTLTITAHTENVNNGGEFTAYLNSNSNATFDVFCVDYQNYISGIPTTFTVNVDTLPNIVNTRYASANNYGGSAPAFSYFSSAGSAENRYLLAGYLTTTYDFTSGVTTQDQLIQDAIWNLLDVNNTFNNNGSSTNNAAINTIIANAIAWESGQTTTQLNSFASRVNIYTDVLVDTPGACSSPFSCGAQEYLSVSPATTTPEPADFALVGIGLLGFGLLRKRAKA